MVSRIYSGIFVQIRATPGETEPGLAVIIEIVATKPGDVTRRGIQAADFSHSNRDVAGDLRRCLCCDASGYSDEAAPDATSDRPDRRRH